MAVPPRKIFISYRRSDHPEFVERIRDWFIHNYGRANVFMDFDTIPPMVHFPTHIRKEVEQCDIFVAVIGPQWLELLQEKAKAFEEDYLRLELSLALQLSKPVGPICIMDARMPRKNDLPEDLRSLLDYNAGFLRAGRDFLDNIENILEAVKQEFKKKAQERYERASTKSDINDFKGAIIDLNEAIRLDPEFDYCYFIRGLSYGDLQDYQKELADYTEAIRLNPNHYDYYNERAGLFCLLNNFDDAVSDYNRLVQLQPNSAYVWQKRGEARFALEHYDAALIDFIKAMEITPRSESIVADMALTEYRQGHEINAVKAWKRIVSQNESLLDRQWLAKHFNWNVRLLNTAEELNDKISSK